MVAGASTSIMAKNLDFTQMAGRGEFERGTKTGVSKQRTHECERVGVVKGTPNGNSRLAKGHCRIRQTAGRGSSRRRGRPLCGENPRDAQLSGFSCSGP